MLAGGGQRELQRKAPADEDRVQHHAMRCDMAHALQADAQDAAQCEDRQRLPPQQFKGRGKTMGAEPAHGGEA